MSPTEPHTPPEQNTANTEPGTPTVPLLEVSELTKSFGEHHVLRGIDLEVNRGQVLALIGPSGSGKTTVLRSLNTLEIPDRGVVRIGKSTVDFTTAQKNKRALADLRDRSAMVFQHYNLFPHMTVLQNVIEGPTQVQRVPRAEAIATAESLLDRVGLLGKKDAHPYELSGGQQQRVGIIRAVALQPELLLFDEPTSALDPELVGDVLTVIRELAQEGWTMVIVTHELSFAREIADQVVFMADGVVVERGAAAQVLSSPQQKRTQQFLQRVLHN